MPGDYLLRVWGADIERVRAIRPSERNDMEREEPPLLNYWFETPEERRAFMGSLPTDNLAYSCKDPGADNDEELIDTHAETIAKVTLQTPDGCLFVYEQSFGFGYPEHSVRYMYEEGNFSCDCNRSLFIARYCGNGDDDLDEVCCGDTIKLVNLTVEKRK